MSMAKCHVCDRVFDTDDDPDSCVADRFVCEPCRDRMDKDAVRTSQHMTQVNLIMKSIGPINIRATSN